MNPSDEDIPYGDDWQSATNVATWIDAADRTRFAAARFVAASFKSGDWVQSVAGPFDGIVSMQAVHELRHKRHAPQLYRQVHEVTAPLGRLLICDHLPLDDTPRSLALYMTEQEQLAALSSAGFSRVRTVLAVDTLLLYVCEKA
jgi:hypothetical protein